MRCQANIKMDALRKTLNDFKVFNARTQTMLMIENLNENKNNERISTLQLINLKEKKTIETIKELIELLNREINIIQNGLYYEPREQNNKDMILKEMLRDFYKPY